MKSFNTFGFSKYLSFNLDSGIEVELQVEGEYKAEYEVFCYDHSMPPGEDAGPDCVDVSIKSVDIEDAVIEVVMDDEDDDPSHYSLTENELRRLTGELYDIVKEDFLENALYKD